MGAVPPLEKLNPTAGRCLDVLSSPSSSFAALRPRGSQVSQFRAVLCCVPATPRCTERSMCPPARLSACPLFPRPLARLLGGRHHMLGGHRETEKKQIRNRRDYATLHCAALDRHRSTEQISNHAPGTHRSLCGEERTGNNDKKTRARQVVHTRCQRGICLTAGPRAATAAGNRQ